MRYLRPHSTLLATESVTVEFLDAVELVKLFAL